MADNISYKGYLRFEKSGEEEVRRFMISKDMSNNFSNLKEKLVVVFPQLSGKDISITWTDADGDNVTIDSDEELKIALSEMTGTVNKINILVQGEKKNNGSTGEIHPGVTCDGCEGPVVGCRYKCMVCPDYDLCERCEAKGLHKDHNMMRLSSSQGQWPRHFFKRLHKIQERMDLKMKEKKGEEKEEDQIKFAGPGGRGCMRGRGGNGGRGEMRGRGGMRGIHNGMFMGPNPFGAMMHGWMGPEIEGAAYAQVNSAHEAAHKAATDAAGSGTSDPSTAYLMNMGNLIAAALDPFDINVDVSVETPEGVCTSISSSSTAASTAEKEEEAKKPTSKDSTPEQDVDDGWAVPVCTPLEESASAKADTATEAVHHPDPKIKVALEAMMNMGFSNDGGWLTNLLEAKNGDIGKVLDMLQPVKKGN